MTANTQQTVLRLEPREDFVLAPDIEQVCRRAMAYLDAGYPCHFRGSAGTGKTTLALHVARQRGRPVILMFGDEEIGTSDRSEEHTSELQSQSNLVCRLLLEKKK